MNVMCNVDYLFEMNNHIQNSNRDEFSRSWSFMKREKHKIEVLQKEILLNKILNVENITRYNRRKSSIGYSSTF
jgi:hypothetical protein